MSKEAIQKAVAIAGTQQELVELMKPHLPGKLAQKFRQGHVSNWLRRERLSEVPPADYVLPMSAAVDRRILPHEIRPDIYPALCEQGDHSA